MRARTNNKPLRKCKVRRCPFAKYYKNGKVVVCRNCCSKGMQFCHAHHLRSQKKSVLVDLNQSTGSKNHVVAVGVVVRSRGSSSKKVIPTMMLDEGKVRDVAVPVAVVAKKVESLKKQDVAASPVAMKAVEGLIKSVKSANPIVSKAEVVQIIHKSIRSSNEIIHVRKPRKRRIIDDDE